MANFPQKYVVYSEGRICKSYGPIGVNLRGWGDRYPYIFGRGMWGLHEILLYPIMYQNMKSLFKVVNVVGPTTPRFSNQINATVRATGLEVGSFAFLHYSKPPPARRLLAFVNGSGPNGLSTKLSRKLILKPVHLRRQCDLLYLAAGGT